MNKENIKLNEALEAFDFGGQLIGAVRFGKGHINDTFAVYTQENDECVRYILQRVNSFVFKNPIQVMSNIKGVTDYIKNIISQSGGDVKRETLSLVNAKDGNYFFTDSDGAIWRVYSFIEDAYCFQSIEKPEHFYNSAVAFGTFQKYLGNYPAETLYETIPMFHNTKNRYKNFEAAVSADKLNRAKDVLPEIEFFKARKEDCNKLVDLLESGKLPLRVTHNDTKLNNVMIDKKTEKGICVIDLDTVMPGLSVYDFGDSIRFGANHSAEDEKDLSKVNFDIELFDIYAKGYLEAAGDTLTDLEKECLSWGAKLMTLECGMRFLTDYLEGDVYFKIHREGQNLDRARTQIKLVSDMENCWQEMYDVIKKYS